MHRSVTPADGGLAPIVEKIWVCRIDGADGHEVLLPTGRSQLILGLDPANPKAIIHGPTTEASVIDSSAQRLAVGVSLRPGGLAALTGESATAFVDRQVPAGGVLGFDVDGLVEAVRAELERGQTTTVLERAIGHQLRIVDRGPTTAIHRSIALLGGGRSVAEVCDELGVRRSRFVGLFRSEVGVTPKLFSRLKRFEGAVARVRQRHAESLAAVANRSGYADQAHMTREFRELAGRSPGRLHRDGSPSPNHLRP
ncbi:MAG: helix-turn-helix domain-containing protein [Actinomycetota bacterium]